MFCFLRHFRIVAALGFAVFLADPVRAEAGWMGFRNDTGATHNPVRLADEEFAECILHDDQIIRRGSICLA